MLAPLPQPPVEPVSPGNGEVTELVLLLPVQQVAVLDEAARRWGLTTGQVLRGLIREFLAHPTGRPPL
jgi:hypothetical protein